MNFRLTIRHIIQMTLGVQLRVQMMRNVSSASILRLVVSLLLMMVVGVNSAWGQINIDFSGKYCIANKNGYNSSTPESNYYLVPATNSNYNNDSNKPHLTTTQSGKVSTSYWTIKKTGDYYHIIYADGRYLTANSSYPGTTGDAQKRLRVHLEQMGDPGNSTLFIITPNKNGGFNIKHKDISEEWSLDPAGGNLNGAEINSDRTMSTSNGTVNVGHGIGYWTDEEAARWVFEDIVERPVVSINSDGKAVISSTDATATFYYTTDGTTTPTTGSTQYTGPVDITGVETIKAVAVVNGESSNVATYTVGTGMPYIIQNQECNAYYLVSGDPTVANVPANTSSIAGPKMEWLLKYAGNVNGIQYYYFVNNATKHYLYRDGDNIYVKAFADNVDGYRFNFFTKNADDSYNIYPKDVTNKSLYKTDGNVVGANNSKNVALNTALTNDLAHWKFVSTSNVTDKRTLFEASPVVASSYYKIANGYEIKNPSAPRSFIMSPIESGGTEYAGVSTAETNDNMVWMFEEAGHDEWQTYYNIVSATTGKYMYFAGSATATSAQANAIEMKDNLTENERYQFVLARSTNADYYYIIPKTHKDVFKNNQFYSIWYNNPTTILQTTLSRSSSANNVKWKFENAPSTFVAPPMVTFNADEMKVYMESSTQDITKIQYSFTKDAEAAPATATTDYPSGGIDVKYGPVYHFVGKTFKGGNESILSPVKDIDLSYIETPTAEVSGNSVTFSTSQKGITFYYTTGGETPSYTDMYTHTGTATDEAVLSSDGKYKATINLSAGLYTIKVIAVSIWDDANKTGYSSAYVMKIADMREATTITSLDQIDNKSGLYKLSGTSTITGTPSVGNTEDDAFEGVLDGDFKEISLSAPLFKYVKNATIKNVIVSNANSISGNGNMGAICQEASGTTRIYNCGVLEGSVTSNDGAAGGLVGHITSGSNVRVVNCYNYATISGSTHAAGIVGWNEGTVGDVRIAMCMMYGDITSGTIKSPVYAGNHTSNAQNFTEYNYYLYSNERDASGNRIIKVPYTAYNDQLAIDKDEYLTRFPFYRHILNTHRELAGYFLFDDYLEDHVNEIGHWVKKKGDDAPKYPVVESWVKNTTTTPTQTKNNLPNTTEDYAGKLLTTMGNGGYLNVSIKIGSHSYTESLPITDMDTLRYDYTYGKVILPFANEYEVNTDYSQICTGWKITKVGSNTSSSVTNYNFADRDNLQKDIYSEATNPFIYAQGGYYIVPTGVTSIEITANFATAYYLSDNSYDIGYKSDYTGRTALGGNTPTNFHGQAVYNSLATAVSALSVSTTNPHEQAIVLVGNYHYDLAKTDLVTGKGFTLMSIDADNNQEPDYGFYSIAPDRPQTPALRFDFVPIISLGMAAKVNGSYYYPGVPIWKPRGWYEQTETTVSIMNQFELDSGNFTNAENGNGQNPCIINGGYFAQIIRSNNGNCSKVSYFKIGGNAYIKEFYPGSHSNQTRSTTIVPVNVTGGQVDECFMTGYKSGAKAIGSDIRFWCSGGKIKKFLGAYMDKPMQTSTSTDENPGTVNMTAHVDHALISRFFGGGTSQNAAITGDIKVTINNSKVDFYCGGPEFGDMSSGKVVETTANNTKFGEYYGAGFGGTSITYSPKDGTPAIGANVAFPSGYYTYGSTRLTNPESLGLATCYKFEYLMHSANKSQLVARFITGYANFSLATTGNVTNTLTGCTIEKDFYGAGCQGKVDGTVTSSLTGCTVKRNAFGGGYKAENNTVEVYPAAAPVPLSTYNGVTGIFSDFGTTTPETFTWKDGSSDPDDTGKKLYTGMTEDEMKELGNVTGAISLTIDGGYVGGTSLGQTSAESATATTPAIPAGGCVYGGGNESKSLNNTTVTLKGNAEIYGDVFGGGNKANVTGSATVNIEQ